MAGFGNMKVTTLGKKIINDLLQGNTKVTFTRVELGDGDKDIEIEQKTALTHKILDCKITSIKEFDEDKVKISFYFNNQDENLKEGFYFKEIGVYAKDTLTNEEVLFCYANSTYNAEYIDAGAQEIIERYIDIIVFCGNAESVEITLNKDEIFVNEKTLAEILKRRVYHFENVEEMKKCLTLIPGDVVQTLGYYEANDGGGALYRIVNDSTLTDDGGLVHDLKIGSKAKLIVNKNSVIAEQAGFKKNDSSFDNKTVMDRIMNSSNLNSKVLEIVFGNGIYRFTDTLLKSNIHIKAKLGVFAEEEVSTVFAPFSSDQRYVMKLGGTENFDTPQNLSDYYSKNYSIDGVVFSDNLYNLKQDDTETEKYGLLCVEYGANVYLNVGFKNCFSRCIYLRNCWEIEFENLYLRAIYTNTEVSALYVDNVLSDGTSNTSRILFKNIDIELLNSQFIKTGNSPNMTNITIDVLSIENGRTSTALGENSGRMVSKFSNVDLELYKSCQIKSLFELNQCDGLSINILNIHNFASGYYHTGEKDTEGEYIKYVDGLFKFNGYYNVAVNQINLNHSGAYINLATGAGGYLGHAIFNCIEQGYYNNSTNSTGDAIIPAYLFYDVTVGSVEVVKTNCIVNYNELNVLHSGIYQNTELFKLSGRQMGKIRLEYDANSISKYVLKNFTESASTRFLDKIFVPFNCKLIARGKMGHNVKLDLILVKDDVQTTKSVDTSVNEVNKYKDYVYTLENEDYDYMYLKGQGPLFKLDYVEIQRI